jgi:hypothetical protein
MDHSSRILSLIIEGVRPSKIAETLNTPIGQVTEEITSAIQERRLQRSRVLATLDNEWQNQIAVWFSAWKKKPHAVSTKIVHGMLKESNLDNFDLSVEEVGLYLLCFEKGFRDGEIYEALCEIERTLHAKIRQILIEKFGAEENGWWRQGIQLDVRKYCVERREEDNDFPGSHPYNFTTLGHLGQILMYKQNPELFKKRFPLGANKKTPEMQAISKDFEQLRKIRNRVMHPIGEKPPTEEDFFFVKEMQVKFDLAKWR